MAYTPDEKANALAVLAACGGNFAEAERSTGILKRQIRRWAEQYDVKPVKITNDQMTQIVQEKKKAIDDMLEEWTRTCIQSFPGKLPDASLRDASGSMKLSIEAMRLLREEPTSINASMRSLTPEQLLDEINAIIAAPDEDPKLKLIGD